MLENVFSILYVYSLWDTYSLYVFAIYLFIQLYMLRKLWVDSAYCQSLNEFCITTMNAELSHDPIQRTRLQLLECHHLPIYSISPAISVYTHTWREDYDQYEFSAAIWNDNCQSMKGLCCSLLLSLISLWCITAPIPEQHYFILHGLSLHWKL